MVNTHFHESQQALMNMLENMIITIFMFYFSGFVLINVNLDPHTESFKPILIYNFHFHN